MPKPHKATGHIEESYLDCKPGMTTFDTPRSIGHDLGVALGMWGGGHVDVGVRSVLATQILCR
jgi:hypothetical protein